MPIDSKVLNLRHFLIEKIEGARPVRIYARYTGEISCPHCHSKSLRNKGTFTRILHHESFGLRKCFLHLESCKYHCKDCGKYFNMRFPGIKPRRRSTEPFRREAFKKHRQGVNLSELSDQLGVSYSTIDRWNNEFQRWKIKEKLSYPCPKHLGIDEHFFTRKQGFATTFCDLNKRRVFDVVLGRSDRDLFGYLQKLEGRKNVEVVCTDLSESYRSIVRRWFPKAKIVADRFHVIKLINYHFMNYWNSVDPEGRRRIRLQQAMRKHRKNLSENQRNKLDVYLEKFPILKASYYFKQKLCRLMLHKDKRQHQASRLIGLFLLYIQELKQSPLKPLGETLESWCAEIGLMWCFSKNNGITEGFHNKMEMISRRAYGFRNFENYRLRVRTLCS